MSVSLPVKIKQIYKEIEYVNNQFQNLRTYIVPDPKCERSDLFYFVMFPADGSLADKPIVGKMFFPSPYPEYPPTLHLFTKTFRYNVDVFYCGENSFSSFSSMCFDILTKKGETPYSTWEKGFNLAAVFASLLQVIVSVKVKQQYGDYEVVELVSMEKMVEQHEQVDLIWKKYKHFFPKCPEIKHISAKMVPVAQKLNFFNQKIQLSYEQNRKVYSSDSFFLYDADFSILIDLTDLKKISNENHKYNFVISFIIGNTRQDVLGRRSDTVLIRNGITGTAAKKLNNGDTQWFYHGKPLVDFNKVLITVSRRQITMVVIENDDFENAKIHGDTVLSYLTDAEMGESANENLYNFVLFVQTKHTIPCSQNLEKLFIRIKTDNEFGFIHPSDRYNSLDQPIQNANLVFNQPVPILFKLNINFFQSKKIVLNKKSYKYLNDLIIKYDKGRVEKQDGVNMIILNKFQVQCLKGLLSDWLKSLPVGDRDPKEWVTVIKSTVMEENSNSVSFWSNLKHFQKPKTFLLEYEPTQVYEYFTSRVSHVGIDLGNYSEFFLKKLFITNKSVHLLNNYKKLVHKAKVCLAFHKDFDDVDKFNEFLNRFQVDELVMVKIIGLIYNRFQLVLLVEGCNTIANNELLSSCDKKRNLFIEYGYKDYDKVPKSLVHHLRRFDGNIKDYLCEENEKMQIFDQPLVCLGKIKFYLFKEEIKKFRTIEW